MSSLHFLSHVINSRCRCFWTLILVRLYYSWKCVFVLSLCKIQWYDQQTWKKNSAKPFLSSISAHYPSVCVWHLNLFFLYQAAELRSIPADRGLRMSIKTHIEPHVLCGTSSNIFLWAGSTDTHRLFGSMNVSGVHHGVLRMYGELDQCLKGIFLNCIW